MTARWLRAVRIDDLFGPWRFAVAALLLAPLLISCGGKQQLLPTGQKIRVGTELASEQVLTRQLGADPRTLDPSLATDVVGMDVLEDLFEGLVSLSEDGNLIPGVATSWETSADGKTWTFHLRQNAKWSNGQPVTANDFVYAWRREVDPNTGSEYAQALAPIENAADIITGKMDPQRLGVEATGPQTLVVHLHAPTSYLLALLTNPYLYPLYEPVVKQWGDAWTQPAHMVSNGPFQLSDRVINGHITIQKNPYYWDAGHVRLSKVTYNIISDSNSAVEQYLAGSLDFSDSVNLSQKDYLQRTLGDQVVFAPYFGTAMFGYNLAKPPFKGNPKLRLALNMALDRKTLVKYVQRGVGVPAYNLVPPLPGYDPPIPDWARLPDDQRHALARKLYQEAGYSQSHPLEVVLTYPSGGPSVRRFMEALAAMWQINLGAKVEIYNVEWKVFLQNVQMKQPTFYWFAWIGDFPDPFTFMQLFQSDFGMNHGGYDNPKFDALVNQASNTVDAAQRYKLFHQAGEILNQDAPFLPAYFYESGHLIKPYVKGWQSNVMDRNLSRYMYVLAHQEG
ncbi:MAG TPA: peptide ABC transporter substrate-binding protein [Candidatus Dormibacteraeota bacterium]|nr:peptide ABC transporter substrate-binding protein [Candidatus Dormibacteraeota bacterium]